MKRRQTLFRGGLTQSRGSHGNFLAASHPRFLKGFAVSSEPT
ncbi:hypothetical protein ACFPRL_30045 [Pseudoclavibacter helvolus]